MLWMRKTNYVALGFCKGSQYSQYEANVSYRIHYCKTSTREITLVHFELWTETFLSGGSLIASVVFLSFKSGRGLPKTMKLMVKTLACSLPIIGEKWTLKVCALNPIKANNKRVIWSCYHILAWSAFEMNFHFVHKRARANSFLWIKARKHSKKQLSYKPTHEMQLFLFISRHSLQSKNVFMHIKSNTSKRIHDSSWGCDTKSNETCMHTSSYIQFQNQKLINKFAFSTLWYFGCRYLEPARTHHHHAIREAPFQTFCSCSI